MFICNNADNNGVLRVRFRKLNVFSSSKACPLALMQRVARVTMQSKERWIVCEAIVTECRNIDVDLRRLV